MVKNDGGYRAVFTDQGASASQVAAAWFLNTNFPDTVASRKRGQRCSASPCVGASVRRFQIITIAGERALTSVDKTTTHTKIETIGVLMYQWFSLSETYTVTFRQGCCGKESSKKYFSNTIGKQVPTWGVSL